MVMLVGISSLFDSSFKSNNIISDSDALPLFQFKRVD